MVAVDCGHQPSQVRAGVQFVCRFRRVSSLSRQSVHAIGIWLNHNCKPHSINVLPYRIACARSSRMPGQSGFRQCGRDSQATERRAGNGQIPPAPPVCAGSGATQSEWYLVR